MNRKLVTIMAVVMVVMSVAIAGASAQSAATPTELAFLLDGSSSIAGSEFSVMKEGIAQAIVNPNCVPQNGELELTIVQFASTAQVELAPTAITAANAATAANQVRAISQLNTATNYEAAFTLAASTVRFALPKQVINIATDGEPNQGQLNPVVLRNNAVAAGFDEINAEGIGLGSREMGPDQSASPLGAIDILSALVYPQPAYISPPGAWPPPGPGWVRLVDDPAAFAATVCEKFQQSVSPGPSPTPIPEPTTILLLGSGAAGLAAYIRKRRQA